MSEPLALVGLLGQHVGLNFCCKGFNAAIADKAYMEAMAEMEDRLKREHATAGTCAPYLGVVRWLS